MQATASYSAVPSILTVAPIGKTKRATLGSTLLMSLTHFIVAGRVAALKNLTSYFEIIYDCSYLFSAAMCLALKEH
jgi:hypothetical protein